MGARVVVAVTAGLALAGCGSRVAAPVEQTGVWRLVPPGREHVDPKRLAATGAWADRGVPSLTALLVARHGRLVFERYYHLGAANQREPILSITKSVVSTLVGIALGEGRLKTLDLKVGRVLGDDVPKGADARVGSITLRVLLTMTSGYGSAATDPIGDGGNAYRTTPNWVRTILGTPLARPPGESFDYDNGDAHLVSALLQRVTGTTTATFAREKLFRPLRIDPGNWWADRQGVTDGAAGLQLKPRDLAKLGELSECPAGSSGARARTPRARRGALLIRSWRSPLAASLFSAYDVAAASRRRASAGSGGRSSPAVRARPGVGAPAAFGLERRYQLPHRR